MSDEVRYIGDPTQVRLVGDVGVPQLILVGEWSCPECGYTAEGDRPQCCPICSTPIGAGQ